MENRTIHVGRNFAQTFKAEKKHSKSRIAAFYDYDKTMIAKDSMSVECTEILIPNFGNTLYYIAMLGWVLLLDLLHISRFFPDFGCRQYFGLYRGLSLQALERLYEQVYETHIRPLVFEEMIQNLEDHRARGHLIVLISASPEHLVRPFAIEVQADLWACTQLETVPSKSSNQICTGRVMGNICCAAEKTKVMQQIAQAYGVDLDQSYAYSDHYDDIPMLQAVANATVIHPNVALENVAKKNDWAISRPKLSLA